MAKVMIVDDDKQFLAEISEVLKMSGYNTVEFSSGSEALKQVILEKPDVILLDLKMEGKGGFEVASKLKCSMETRQIPIVAVTGVYTDNDQNLVIKACGFEKRLIKPVNPLDVIVAIEHALGKSNK